MKNVKNDIISRQAAIDAIVNTVSEIGLHDNSEVARYGATFRQHEIIDILEALPSAQPQRKKGNWTTEQVAEMLANLFGDECACNCINIDEWLPSACKYADTQCPEPKEKHGCWMQFLIQGGGETDE